MYPISSETVPSRSINTALNTHQLPRRTADVFHRNGIHAAMIDRTLAQQTWTAFDGLFHDSYASAMRAGDTFVGGTEDGDRGDSQRCGDMHRAGIVGDHQ